MTFTEWAWGEVERRLVPVLRLVTRDELQRAELVTRTQLETAMSELMDRVGEVNVAIQGAKDRIAADVAALKARIDELVASEALAAELGAELSEGVAALGGVVADLNTIDPIPEPEPTPEPEPAPEEPPVA